MTYKDKKSFIISFTVLFLMLIGFLAYQHYFSSSKMYADRLSQLALAVGFYGLWGLSIFVILIYFIIDAIRGRKDTESYPTGVAALKDMTKGLVKTLSIVIVIIAAIIGAIYWAKVQKEKSIEQVNLQQDAPIMTAAKQAVSYLDNYYKTNHRYPNAQEFYQTFGHRGELSYDWATNEKGQMTDQTFVLTYTLESHHKEAAGAQCDQAPVGILNPGSGTPRYCLDSRNYKQYLSQ